MYIDDEGKLHVGPNEIPSALCTTWDDPRLLAVDPNKTDLQCDMQQAVLELRQWQSSLEDREAAVAAREAKVEALHQKSIEMLSAYLNAALGK
jgi:hypothetical protein